jgi:hypothetical protein
MRSITNPTALSIMSALSFQRTPTNNHPKTPKVLRYKSKRLYASEPVARIAIEVISINEEHHLMYHATISRLILSTKPPHDDINDNNPTTE